MTISYIKKIGISILLLCSSQIKAQLVNCNTFLQANRIEVGVAPNGAFGSSVNAPAGYHSFGVSPFFGNACPTMGPAVSLPNALGFVADWDANGWGVGTPAPMWGDYFLPGSPQEGYAVQVNGLKSEAYAPNNNFGTGFSGTGSLTGTNVAVTSTGTSTTGIWQGTFGALALEQRTTVFQDKLYFIVEVKMKNTGTTPLNGIYYNRTLDPDNEQTVTGNFTTINNINFQLPSPANKVLVSAVGTTYSQAYLGLGTKDCRAKAYIYPNSLTPPDDLDIIFNQSNSSYIYTGGNTADCGVGLVFNVGTINPGDSTNLKYAYILNQAFLDSAFLAIDPNILYNGTIYPSNDTIDVCANSNYNFSINNGSSLTWVWVPNPALTYTSGTTNTVAVGTTPVTCVAISGNPICPDTVRVTFMPTQAPNLTTTNVFYCTGQTPSPLTAPGVNLLWYLTATGGTGSTTAPTPSTAVQGTTSYWVSQTVNGCESPRAQINVVVDDTIQVVLFDSTCSSTYTWNGVSYTSSGTYSVTNTSFGGCDSITTLNLYINTTPIPVTLNQTICVGDNYNFYGTNYSSPGSYSHTIITPGACDTTVTLNLSVSPLNTKSISPVICYGTNYFFNGQFYSATGTYTDTVAGIFGCDTIYTINLSVIPPTNTNVYDTICSGATYNFYGTLLSTTGTYTHKLFNSIGCDSNITLHLQVKPLPITAISISNPTICDYQTTNIGIAGAPLPAATYSWSYSGGNVLAGSPPVGPYTLSWSNSGSKLIYLTVNNGCVYNTTAIVTVNPSPVVDIVTPEGVCLNDVITISATSTVPNVANINWGLDGGTLSTGSTGTLGPLGIIYNTVGTKNLTLNLQSTDGCVSNNASKQIEVYSLPIVDAEYITEKLPFCENDNVIVTTPPCNCLFEWTAPTLPFPIYQHEFIYTAQTPATLNLKVTSDKGCISNDILPINPEACGGVFIPNVFSPNGDGKNDEFDVISQVLLSKEMTIYNRWGQEVFYTQDINTGWKGNIKGGNPAEAGVYFYIIRLETRKDGYQVFKGDLTLLR